MTFEEHQSRVIQNIQHLLADLDEVEPLPRGAVIGGLLAVTAAVARNPRESDEKAWTQKHFLKLAERAFVVAEKILGPKAN